jgi:hypothetical protein
MSWAKSENINRRRACELAAFLGLAAAATDLSDVLGAPLAAAQPQPYRSAADVPASWRDFALQLQARLQQRLAADDDIAGKVAGDMGSGGKDAADASPPTVMIRVWVSPGGKIERLVFDDFNGKAADALRLVLTSGDVGLPPPDMLQPLRLRLSLRPKPQDPKSEDPKPQDPKPQDPKPQDPKPQERPQ